MKAARKYLCLVVLGLCALPAAAQNYEACGPLENAYGPYDYRKAPPQQRYLVEGSHFTAQVERLERGKTSHNPGPDIDYTLRAFPNHPRALLAMMRLGEKTHTEKPVGSRWTIACWFDRAVRFQEDDGAIRMLYGTYLARNKKSKEAIEQLEIASQLLGDDDGNAHYNMGLAYADVQQYDKALVHAHKAYALGFDLPGLKNKLQRAGKWKPLPPEPAAPATPVAEIPKLEVPKLEVPKVEVPKVEAAPIVPPEPPPFSPPPLVNP